MGLLPEDRKYQGLVLKLSVLQNVSMASLDKIKKNGLLQLKMEKIRTQDFINKLRIITPSVRSGSAEPERRQPAESSPGKMVGQ